MEIIGRALSPAEFRDYLGTFEFADWRPSCVVVHHTAAPCLATRPKGILQEHIANLKAFYEDKGWGSGPHLFVDEDQIWLFSPLTRRGTHAVAFNRTGVGIEMLGDYDTEDPWSGRGLQVLTTAATAAVFLLRKMGAARFGDGEVKFHRDDPNTSKTCPGDKISKHQFIALMGECAARYA